MLKSLAGVAGMALASYGVDLLIRGIDKLIVTTDEHREQLAGIKTEYDGIAASLERVGARAKETKEQMAEIEKGGVTQEEQPVYRTLVEDSVESIKQQGVLSMDAQQKNLEAAHQFVKTMESAYAGTAVIVDEESTKALREEIDPSYNAPTQYKTVSQQEKQLDDIRQLARAGLRDGGSALPQQIGERCGGNRREAAAALADVEGRFIVFQRVCRRGAVQRLYHPVGWHEEGQFTQVGGGFRYGRDQRRRLQMIGQRG